MSAPEITEKLMDLINEVAEMDAEDRDHCMNYEYDELEEAEVTPYNQAGVMTNDDGFVLTLKDGREFQITVLQSK